MNVFGVLVYNIPKYKNHYIYISQLARALSCCVSRLYSSSGPGSSTSLKRPRPVEEREYPLQTQHSEDRTDSASTAAMEPPTPRTPAHAIATVTRQLEQQPHNNSRSECSRDVLSLPWLADRFYLNVLNCRGKGKGDWQLERDSSSNNEHLSSGDDGTETGGYANGPFFSLERLVEVVSDGGGPGMKAAIFGTFSLDMGCVPPCPYKQQCRMTGCSDKLFFCTPSCVDNEGAVLRTAYLCLSLKVATPENKLIQSKLQSICKKASTLCRSSPHKEVFVQDAFTPDASRRFALGAYIYASVGLPGFVGVRWGFYGRTPTALYHQYNPAPFLPSPRFPFFCRTPCMATILTMPAAGTPVSTTRNGTKNENIGISRMAEEIPCLFSTSNRTIPVLVLHGDKTLKRRRRRRPTSPEAAPAVVKSARPVKEENQGEQERQKGGQTSEDYFLWREGFKGKVSQERWDLAEAAGRLDRLSYWELCMPAQVQVEKVIKCMQGGGTRQHVHSPIYDRRYKARSIFGVIWRSFRRTMGRFLMFCVPEVIFYHRSSDLPLCET